MKKIIATLTASALVLSFVGCATQNTPGMDKDTAVGAGAGAVAGAVLGQVIGGNTKGTAIGAAVGAVAGGLAGNQYKKMHDKMQQDAQGTGVQVKQQADNSIKLEIPSNISFASGSAAISPAFRTTLDKFASTLTQPEYAVTQVNIVGHTDNVGSDAANQKLSLERATNVANYLAERGVARTRIVAEGHGETQPVADNATETGRAQNRRIEIFIR